MEGTSDIPLQELSLTTRGNLIARISPDFRNTTLRQAFEILRVRALLYPSATIDLQTTNFSITTFTHPTKVLKQGLLKPCLTEAFHLRYQANTFSLTLLSLNLASLYSPSFLFFLREAHLNTVFLHIMNNDRQLLTLKDTQAMLEARGVQVVTPDAI